jgi:hypothetical protein
VVLADAAKREVDVGLRGQSGDLQLPRVSDLGEGQLAAGCHRRRGAAEEAVQLVADASDPSEDEGCDRSRSGPSLMEPGGLAV